MSNDKVMLYRAWFGDLYREIVLVNLVEDVNHFEANERVLFTCNSACLIKNHLNTYAKNLNCTVKCLDDIKGLNKNRGSIFVNFICDKHINTENINHRLDDLYDDFWVKIKGQEYNYAWDTIKIILCLFQTNFILLDAECRIFKHDYNSTTLKQQLLNSEYRNEGLFFVYDAIFSFIFNVSDTPHINKVLDKIIKKPINTFKLLVKYSNNYIGCCGFNVILTNTSNCYYNYEKEKTVRRGYCMGNKIAFRLIHKGFIEEWYDDLNYNSNNNKKDIKSINKEITNLPYNIKQHIELFRDINRYTKSKNYENLQQIKKDYNVKIYMHRIFNMMHEIYIKIYFFTKAIINY